MITGTFFFFFSESIVKLNLAQQCLCYPRGTTFHVVFASWHSCMGEVVSEFPGICSLSFRVTDGDPGGNSLEVSLLPCQRVRAPFNCEENLIPLSMP